MLDSDGGGGGGLRIPCYSRSGGQASVTSFLISAIQTRLAPCSVVSCFGVLPDLAFVSLSLWSCVCGKGGNNSCKWSYLFHGHLFPVVGRFIGVHAACKPRHVEITLLVSSCISVSSNIFRTA